MTIELLLSEVAYFRSLKQLILEV